MKLIRYSLFLILCLTLFSSCGIFGSDGDSEPELGTYEVADGLFLENVYKVDGPPPSASNSPNLPFDSDVRLVGTELLFSAKTRVPITQVIFYETGAEEHYVYPTQFDGLEAISFDFCEMSQQYTGVTCTDRCITLSTIFQDCRGAEHLVEGSGITQTEFVQQTFAAACSQASNDNLIGGSDSDLFLSEFDYLWEIWLGNNEFEVSGVLDQLGITCDVTGSGEIDEQGNRIQTERINVPASPPVSFSFCTRMVSSDGRGGISYTPETCHSIEV